jgi:predicted amidohydrolase
LICADLWNPALVHSALLNRPTLLCAPINSASGAVSDDFSNERNWGVNLSFYAMTYGTPVIMANRYGPEGDSHFWGGSRILDPRGHVLAQADDQEGLITATLSYRQIARARFELPTHRDAYVHGPRLKNLAN